MKKLIQYIVLGTALLAGCQNLTSKISNERELEAPKIQASEILKKPYSEVVPIKSGWKTYDGKPITYFTTPSIKAYIERHLEDTANPSCLDFALAGSDKNKDNVIGGVEAINWVKSRSKQ